MNKMQGIVIFSCDTVYHVYSIIHYNMTIMDFQSSITENMYNIIVLEKQPFVRKNAFGIKRTDVGLLRSYWEIFVY